MIILAGIVPNKETWSHYQGHRIFAVRLRNSDKDLMPYVKVFKREPGKHNPLDYYKQTPGWENTFKR